MPEVQNQQSQYDMIVKTIDDKKEKLSAFLPESLVWDKARMLFQSALTATPELLQCNVPSVYKALETSFKLGLEPNGPLQECWLIPYRDHKRGGMNAQCQIGYKGWLKLANNSAEVLAVRANVVYRQEVESGHFKMSISPPSVAHDVDPLANTATWTDDDICGAYAEFDLVGGSSVVSWMSRGDLDEKEKQSKMGWRNSKQFPTKWKGMARKAAILQAFNRREVPINSEKIRMAVDQEQTIEDMKPADWKEQGATDAPPPPEITGPEVFESRHDHDDEPAPGPTDDSPF